MDLFRIILQAHSEANGQLDRKERGARSADGKAKWAQRRMVNDHAYFVMLFAQLESLVDERCDKLVAGKKAGRHWKARRLWDSIDLDRLAFMQRVALLCEKGQAVYGKVRRYYGIRCEIAHGDSPLVGPIALSMIVPDLFGIAAALKVR